MWRLKRGKRPELLKRGFEINTWNECVKIVNNKKLKIRKRRGNFLCFDLAQWLQ